ncbi:MAG: cytochrome c oxidase assembly protein [Oricola sp.]
MTITQRNNTLVAVVLAGVFVGMIGMAYASVPLYKLFCQVTGYGGTTQRAEAPTGVILDKTVTVRFDANTNGIGWEFRPDRRSVTIRIGEAKQISYRARNLTSDTVTGTATFNVTPERAGAYFNKIECFCFTEQTLQPGEEVEMPVVFFIDPDIAKDPDMKDFDTLTLSYTFFPVDDPKPVAQSRTGGEVTQTIQ